MTKKTTTDLDEIRADLERQWEFWITRSFDRMPVWYRDPAQKKQQRDIWVNARMPKGSSE